MKKVLLLILDGWGIREQKDANGIKLANTPNMNNFITRFPNTTLVASGEAVGLPECLMGNSEVGHLNIGAGRIVHQELTIINKSIQTGEFFKNSVLVNAVKHAKQNDSALHLLGLASDAGVHSVLPHLYAILKLAKMYEIERVYFHAFTDGRDSSPTSGIGFIKEIEKNMKEIGIGRIATVGGRYYGMDRDNRWERIKKAYDAIVRGMGLKANSAPAAVEQGYKRFFDDNKQETDEFIQPTVIDEHGTINNRDAAIFFNFRPDRAAEITQTLIDPNFKEFERVKFPQIYYACLTEYKKAFNLPVAYPPVDMSNILAQVLSDRKIAGFRTAETEKFRHITSFFNGSRLEPYPFEDRILVPSPKVSTYDIQPQMSAAHVALTTIKAIKSNEYPFIAVNFANPDMVGHTGILLAVIKAVEMVDFCVGQVVDIAREQEMTVLITADHGNAEEMIDSDGGPHTAHTTNPVPFILINDAYKDVILRNDGVLADIAPTILKLMELSKPDEMTGTGLIK